MGRMDEILDELYLGIPKTYTSSDLEGYGDLFGIRTGLFFTPTDNIPSEWVGEGRLDVVLPLASPTAYEWSEVVGADWVAVSHGMAPPRFIFDGRNALDPVTMRAAGFEYVGVGRGPLLQDALRG